MQCSSSAAQGLLIMSMEVFYFITRTMTLYLDLLFSSDVISVFVRFFPKSSMLDILNEHIFPYQDPCPMQDVSTGWLTLRTAPAARQKTPLHLQSILRMIVQSRVWCRFLPSKILQWPFIACLLLLPVFYPCQGFWGHQKMANTQLNLFGPLVGTLECWCLTCV